MKSQVISFRATVLVAVLAGVTLAGCSTANPDVVARQQSQRALNVQRGTIESIRPVTIEGSQSGVGAATGAVLGGIAGSETGGHRTGVVVGVLGAVIGGVVGNVVEKSTTKEQAVEMILRMDDGRRLAVVQGEGSQGLMPGDKVNLIGNPGNYRVTRYTGQ